jgi:transcriptional regulator with XRE-family HTH domain
MRNYEAATPKRSGMVAMDGAGQAFGTLLLRHRQRAALSQEQLAERAGLSADAVSALERGRRTLPRPETIPLLAEAMDLAAEDRAAFVAVVRPQPGRIIDCGADVPRPRVRCLPRCSAEPLPTALTHFVGREQDLAALWVRLLEPHSRLLTLIGPGGSSKSLPRPESPSAASCPIVPPSRCVWNAWATSSQTYDSLLSSIYRS